MTWQTRAGVKVWTGGPMPDDDRHGTVAGYRAHRAAGERACLDCADAWATYCREKRRESYTPCEVCGTPSGKPLCYSCAPRTALCREWCKRGHRRDADNLTANGSCKTCMRENIRRQRDEERQARLERAIAERWTGVSA